MLPDVYELVSMATPCGWYGVVVLLIGGSCVVSGVEGLLNARMCLIDRE